MEKECDCCGRAFFKRKRDSEKQWNNRKYCSISCKNKSTPMIPIHIRFWRFVDKKSDNECWNWTGSKDKFGYGMISHLTNANPYKAYRLSYEIFNGEIPPSMVVCHKCDNPSCVNPNHLFVGTQKNNMMDCSKKGRLNKKSLLNLQAGAKGYLGAAPRNKELING